MTDVMELSREAARAYDRGDYVTAHQLYTALVAQLATAGWPRDEVDGMRQLRDRCAHLRRGVHIAL